MNTKYIRRILLVVMALLPWSTPDVFSNHPDQIDFCQIYGAVYVDPDPNRADYKVFVEDDEAFCDIKVFKADNRLFADREGLWYFTDKEAFADFTIGYVGKRGSADFTIFLIDTESFAGCN